MSEAKVLRMLAARIRSETLDESPSGRTSDPLVLAREQGYRAGHNDRGRATAKACEEAAAMLEAADVLEGNDDASAVGEVLMSNAAHGVIIRRGSRK
jgi:hypothetical protein